MRKMINTKTIFSGILVMLSLIFTGVTVIEAPVSSWTCYDFSTHYAADNSDWGIVTMSENQLFRGVSHMVNCKNVTADSIEIHDGLYGLDYTLYGWQEQGFYHFWQKDETPLRYYHVMQDNRNQVI
jgi:hypothetical protein